MLSLDRPVLVSWFSVKGRAGQARPAPWGPLGHSRPGSRLWRLSQGLLELEQACPALDDFPNHEAGGRRPQLVVGSWETEHVLGG